jgi:hypothetical protein
VEQQQQQQGRAQQGRHPRRRLLQTSR